MPTDNFEDHSKITLGQLADKLNLKGEAREKFIQENSLDEFCPEPENTPLPLSYDKNGKPQRIAKISVKSLANAIGRTEEEIIKMLSK